MPRTYHRPIKEETITSVLHYLRQEAVREGLDGLRHVDALLRARGVDPETLVVPRKTPKAFARGELQKAILEALRGGPLTGAEIAAVVRGNLAHADAYKRVYIALNRMKGRGMVAHGGRLWHLR